MAVDRGGLNYKIAVQDQFSANTKKFRAEIAAARREWAKFRGELAKPISTKAASAAAKVRQEVQRTARSRRASSREQGEFTKEEIKLQKEISKEAKRQQAVEREATKLRRSATADAKKKASVESSSARQQASAQRQQAAAANRAAAAARRQARAFERTKRAVDRQAVATARANKSQQRLTASVKGTESAANRVAFTFRRLFGILAAFTAARAGLEGFKNLVRSAIDFNRQVEDSKISLASLIVATGDVFQNGKKVTDQQKAFALASAEARRQVQLLRQDSLKTVATFQELLRAFQAGVGPGLEAGLNLDEIREVTVRVSQAAAALTLPQNQLIEEIRSLLRGTIQARTTVVASVLGITNEDVRNAKTAGNLFEFLSGRLFAFSLAADETQKTVTGLLARIRDAVGFSAGEGGIFFFEQLRTTLREIFNSLIKIEDVVVDGKVLQKITPNPRALALFKQLFDAMAIGLSALREGLKTFDFQTLTEGFAAVLAAFDAKTVGSFFQILQSTATLAGAALLGAARAASSLVKILAPLAPLAEALAPLLTLFVQLKVLIAGTRLVAIQLVTVLNVFPAALARIDAALDGVATKATLAQKATRTLGAAFVLLAGLSKIVVNSVTGASLGFVDSITTMLDFFVVGVDRMITEIQNGFSRFSETLGLDLLTNLGTGEAYRAVGKKIGLELMRGVLLGVKALGPEGGGIPALFGLDSPDSAVDEALAATETLIKSLDTDIERLRRESGASLNEFEAAREKRTKEFEARRLAAAERLGKAIAKNDFGAGFNKSLAELRRLQDELGIGVRPKDRSGEIDASSKARIAAQTAQALLTDIQIRKEAELVRAQAEGLTVQQLAVKEHDLEIARLSDELRIRGRLLLTQIEQQKKIVEATEGRKGHIEAQVELAKKEKELAQLIAQTTLKLVEQARERRKAALVESGSLFEGLGAGLRSFSEQFSSSFKAGVAIIKGFVSDLASFISSSIVDAFDPTKDTDLLERFARFLQQIAQLILQQLIQIAIAKAVLGLGVGSSFSGLGFAEGGEVPDKKAPVTPPSGVSKKDTVNAWLQPGEFVQKFAAVRKYGADVMKAINDGIIDPLALRALAFGNRGRHKAVLAHARAGYAEGGVVARTARTVSEASASAGGEPTATALFFNQQQMERALAGGAGVSMKRWMRDNQEELSNLLSSNRS